MNPPRSPSLPRRKFLGQLSLGAAALAFPNVSSSLRAAPVAAKKKLGLAIVGLGRYSTGELAPALRDTEHCQLMGVVTGSREKGEKWAQDFGFPSRNIYDYSTMGRMADNPDIDIVYVVTPVGLHAEHAIAAAKAGKHVISEKPMAKTVAECDAMIAACRAANRTLSIGYRLHFDPYHREMMRLAQTKEFGPFMKMSTENGFHLGMRDGQKPWRATASLGGGGPLMDMGIYSVHAACMATESTPIAVTAKEEPKQRPEFFTDVEETLNYTLEFANGATCTGMTSYERNGGRFRAEGGTGWIEFAPAFGYRGLKVNTSKGPLSYPSLRQQAGQMDGIALAIINGTPSPVPADLGRRDMRIIEAIYAAARSGKRELVKA